MTQQTYGLLYGIVFLILGIILTFFYKRIIKIQGESKKGDFPMNQRIRKLKIGGIGFLIGGIIFILNVLLCSE